MKAFCLWCERNPNSTAARPKDGLAWIHLKCFMEMRHNMGDLEEVKKLLANNEEPEIKAFLQRMEDHRRRWNGSMRFLANATGDDSYRHAIVEES